MTRFRLEPATRRRAGRRRSLALLALVPACTFLSACVGVSGRPAHVHYELRDLGGAKPVGDAPVDRTLLIGWSSAASFYDVTGIAYSRAPGARAYYQFASWSERPAERIAHLLQRRLAQTQAFRDVATTTASVAGEWLLDVQLEQLFHDDTRPPGAARLEVFVRLVDRTKARTIAARRFLGSEPVEAESAAHAVQAFDRAVSRWLDETVAWVLAQSATDAKPAEAR